LKSGLKNPACALGAIFLLFFPGWIMRGEESAGDEDWTVVTCDGNLFMDYKSNRVIFFNNVRVENPRGSIRSDRLIIFFSPDGRSVERTKGEGNVQIKAEGRDGRGERLIYYPAERKAVLSGDAVLTVAGNSVRGGKITFYLDQKNIEVEERPILEYVPDKDFDVDI